MILEDVTNGADFLVEAAPPPHVERFWHRDLHAVDVVAVPDRFQKRVGKPEIEEVLYGLLAEKVIDAINRRLRKRLVNGRIEGLRRREVTTERFFHDDTSVCSTSRACESGGHGTEQIGWDRQMEQRAFGRCEGVAQGIECGGVLIVAGHVSELSS